MPLESLARASPSPGGRPLKRTALVLMCCLLSLIFSLSPTRAEQTPACSQEIDELIKELAEDTPEEIRIRAIKLLRLQSKKALKALPALEKCLKHKEAEVRSHAVQAVGDIAVDHKLQCPLGLLEAYLDPSEDVRDFAGNYVGAFAKYPIEA